jgi:hypothetical protein
MVFDPRPVAMTPSTVAALLLAAVGLVLAPALAALVGTPGWMPGDVRALLGLGVVNAAIFFAGVATLYRWTGHGADRRGRPPHRGTHR